MKMEDIREVAQGLSRLSDDEQQEMAALLLDAIGFLREFAVAVFPDGRWRAADDCLKSVQAEAPTK